MLLPIQTARINDEARRVGLKVNMEKTKVMKINAKNQERIIIAGQGIAEVDEFTYLGEYSLLRREVV